MRRRLGAWMRREVVDAIEPQIASTSEELQRALDDATTAIRQAVHQESIATNAAIGELRKEYETVTAQLDIALDRIGDELEASHATNRALLARVRALEAAKTGRPR